MHDEPPASRPLVIDVGRKAERLLRTLWALDSDGLDQGVGRAHHAVERNTATVADMQSTVGEDFLPRLFNGTMSDQPQAPRMDADDFLVFGPDLHEHGEIRLLECIVKSLLCSFCCGETRRHVG